MSSELETAAATGAEAPPAPEPEWVTRAADEYGWPWVRRNWERAAAVPGAWFDHAKADAAVAQFPKWFTLTILHFAGIPFTLAFWQECIVRLFFGWKRPIDVIDPRTTRRPGAMCACSSSCGSGCRARPARRNFSPPWR
jgi:hypothetical protein